MSSLTIPGLRRFAGRGEFWALADQALVSGTNFATSALLARALGLHGFGAFTLAWMWVLFVASFQMAAISAPMMSIGPKHKPDESRRYYSSVLLAQTLFAVTTCLLTVAGVAVANGFVPHWGLTDLGWPIAGCVIAYQMQDWLRRYLFAVQRPGAAFANDVVSYGGQTLLLIIVSFRGLTIPSALWISALTSAAAFVAGTPMLPVARGAWAELGKTAVRHWRSSKWLTASAVLQWSSGNFILVTAPVYVGVAAAGVLKGAQNIMGVTHIWFQGLENIAPAEAARVLHARGAKAMGRYLRQLTCTWGSCTALFALLIAIWPQFWLHLVYGASFDQYGYVLRWYALVYVVMFVRLPLGAALRAFEHTSPLFLSYAAGTVFALASAVPLVKYFGLSGTLVGLVLMHALMQAVLLRAYRADLKACAEPVPVSRLAIASSVASD